MKITRLIFTGRNIIYPATLGLLAIGYWLTAWQLSIKEQQAARMGFDGEVNGIIVIILFSIAAYTSLFFLATFLLAVKRSLKPVSWTVWILGLLPTFLLCSLFAVSFLQRSVR